MQLLIRSVRIVDADSPYDGQVSDVLIENGLIQQIGPDLPVGEGARIVEAANLHGSPGWIDMRVSAQDPGYEHKEDLTSVCRAAAAGGFTDVVVLPNTQPAVDSKDTLGYIRRMAEGQPVSIHVMAAVTKKTAGEDFTEMLDLHQAGAIAFSDGHHPLQNPDLLLKTLQYLQPINGLLVNRPEEELLTRFGQMHEGIQSTMLGLKGMPALAEELMIERDLRLLEYVIGDQNEEKRKGRKQKKEQADKDSLGPSSSSPLLHFTCLSSARSVELIRRAKARQLPVSCDVAAHQLVFDDAALAGFDTNLKVNPPFRSRDDVKALWAGLADDTIDAVVSDHQPQDAESKALEFDQAEFGITGLETVFALLMTYNRTLSLAQLIPKLTTHPRRVLRLPAVRIDVGQPARLTLFDPAAEWTYARTYSKSKNSPFLGQTLTGRVVGTVGQGQFTHNP